MNLALRVHRTMEVGKVALTGMSLGWNLTSWECKRSGWLRASPFEHILSATTVTPSVSRPGVHVDYPWTLECLHKALSHAITMWIWDWCGDLTSKIEIYEFEFNCVSIYNFDKIFSITNLGDYLWKSASYHLQCCQLLIYMRQTYITVRMLSWRFHLSMSRELITTMLL